MGTVSSNKASVFGVFDGMGGEECGEVASFIAAKNAAKIKIGKTPNADLARFCNDANKDICEYADQNNISSMGTTAAILAFTKKGVTLCNIGDSKIFRMSSIKFEQISMDHTAISAFGTKPPLYQNLGIPPDELIIDPFFSTTPYQNGDLYLICSDGLTDMLQVEEIESVLKTVPFMEAAGELLEKALVRGGKDNITIILCKIERQPMRLFHWNHGENKK